jgi:uncharacterized membrane protein YfcA
VTELDWLAAALIGFVAGVLSGLFGVGGGIVMTPGFDWFLPVPPIVALETPLPVILPTSGTGAFTYWQKHEVDTRAASWMAPAGFVGAIVGALWTEVIDTRILLLATAALLAYQSIGILRGASRTQASTPRPATPAILLGVGLTAGLVSGLMGIGGGIVMVPLLAGWLGMPLKRVLGTSLLTIPALAIPGTVVHAALGNIDWVVVAFATLGAVPGARIGAKRALGTAEHTLRLVVGGFMLVVACFYGVAQGVELLQG